MQTLTEALVYANRLQEKCRVVLWFLVCTDLKVTLQPRPKTLLGDIYIKGRFNVATRNVACLDQRYFHIPNWLLGLVELQRLTHTNAPAFGAFVLIKVSSVIYIYKVALSVVCSQLIGRFPALHSEIDWRAGHRAGHRAGVSERAKRERKRCWNRIRCLYCPAACRRSKRCSLFLFLISWTVYFHPWVDLSRSDKVGLSQGGSEAAMLCWSFTFSFFSLLFFFCL